MSIQPVLNENEYIVILLPKPKPEALAGIRFFIDPVTAGQIAFAIIGAAVSASNQNDLKKWQDEVAEILDLIDSKLNSIRQDIQELGVRIEAKIDDAIFSTYRRDIRAKGAVLMHWADHSEVTAAPLEINSAGLFLLLYPEYVTLRDSMLNLCDELEPSYGSYPVVLIGYAYCLLAARLLMPAQRENSLIKGKLEAYLKNAIDPEKPGSIAEARKIADAILMTNHSILTRDILNRWLVVNWKEDDPREPPGRRGVLNAPSESLVPQRVSSNSVPYRSVLVRGDYAAGIAIEYSKTQKGSAAFPGLEWGRFDAGSGDMVPAEQHVSRTVQHYVKECLKAVAMRSGLDRHIADIKKAMDELG